MRIGLALLARMATDGQTKLRWYGCCLGMIRQFQNSYFDSAYQSTVWGYSAPDFVAVATAYGIQALQVNTDDEVEAALAQCWSKPNEPFLLNIAVDIHTNVYPKMLFGNPITEMEGER